MGVVLQTLVVGLSTGAVYGLVGLGFTLVWALTRTLALAHGDVVVAAVLVAILGVVGNAPVALSPTSLDSVGLVLLALAAGVVLAVATYLVAVRPFLVRSDSAEPPTAVSGWVGGTLIVGLALRGSIGLAFPLDGYAVPDPLHLDSLTGRGVVGLPGGATVPVRIFGVLVIAIVVAVVAERFLTVNRTGRGIRAAAEDAVAAALCGVRIEQAALVAFGIAGLLAAVAGLLLAPDRTVSVDSGVGLGLAGAASALIGGLGSPRGAVVGGLLVGLLQQTVVAIPRLGAQWFDLVPLILLLAVLAVRPSAVGAPGRVAVE